MKQRDIIIYTLVFAGCILLTANIILKELTGNWLLQTPKSLELSLDTSTCTKRPIAIKGDQSDPQLKALADYEQACGSAFADDMMLFTNMPVSNEIAKKLADAMTSRLQKFKEAKITPIVIVEPDSEWGLVDFHEFAEGFYDTWIEAYFKHLKQNGVQSADLGYFTPFPEPMQPYWNNASADDYALSVNRYFKILRKYFPEAKTAILLDLEVSEEGAPQLLAYARLLDESLVDLVGIQGFPWHPAEEDSERQPVLDASQFISSRYAKEVADSLGKKDIMLNTGSYRHKKAENGGEIAVSTEERQAILNGIVSEATKLKDQGYNVTVNIFAEDKLSMQEGTNWSYWQPGQYASSEHTQLFTKFIRDLTAKDIRISLFDARG